MASAIQKYIKDWDERMPYLTENNYLQVILNSYLEYNHRARLDIAKILFEEFKKVPDDLEHYGIRANILGEIFTKMMQSLEDYALLGMMFTQHKKTPMEIFLDNSNAQFAQFFRKAKVGFSEDTVLKMYGLSNIATLIKRRLIDPEEADDFNKEFQTLLYGDGKTAGEIARWKGLGRVYIDTELLFNPRTKKKTAKKSNIVSIYHNLKHAYKVLQPDDLFKKIWTTDTSKPSLHVIDKYTTLQNVLKRRMNKHIAKYALRKIILLGTLDVNFKAAEELFTRIHPQAQCMKTMTYMQFNKLKDPTAPTREFRFLIYISKYKRPKHYDPCPCKSGREFKKCHAIDTWHYESLTYNEDDSS